MGLELEFKKIKRFLEKSKNIGRVVEQLICDDNAEREGGGMQIRENKITLITPTTADLSTIFMI